MSQIEKPAEKDHGWWYRKAFLKKLFYLGFGFLFLVVLATIYSYWNYNKEADTQWRGVEKLISERFEINKESIASGSELERVDFFQIDSIRELEARETFPLEYIPSMPIWGDAGNQSFLDLGYEQDDHTTWFGGGLSKKEAAQKALKHLQDVHGPLITSVEEALKLANYLDPRTNEPCTLDNYHSFLLPDSSELTKYGYFFHSRAVLSIQAHHRDAAFEDVQRLRKLRELTLLEKNQTSLAIATHLHRIYSHLITLGVKEHLWTAQQLESFKKHLSKNTYLIDYRASIEEEFLIYQSLFKLAEEVGFDAILKESGGYSHLGMYYGDLEVELLEDLDIDDLIDYEEFLAECLPSKLSKHRSAHTFTFLLNEVIPRLDERATSGADIDQLGDIISSYRYKNEESAAVMRDWLTTLEHFRILQFYDRLHIAGVDLELYYLKHGSYPSALSDAYKEPKFQNGALRMSWKYTTTKDGFELQAEMLDLSSKLDLHIENKADFF